MPEEKEEEQQQQQQAPIEEGEVLLGAPATLALNLPSQEQPSDSTRGPHDQAGSAPLSQEEVLEGK